MDKLRVRAAWALATFGGVGFAPKGSGTLGSLAAMPVAFFLWKQSSGVAWGIFFLLLGLGIWAADVVIEDSGIQDNQRIVIDEVLGIFLTTSVVPFSWLNYGLCFILFRICDIFKPWPASWLDRNWKGGHGAIADDLGAALWSTLAMFLFARFVLGA